MKKEKVFLSTIAPDAAEMARRFGVGIEIAEFCTAWNMDEQFHVTDAVLQAMLGGISNTTLHGPFNELFPCAIDLKARALAAYRYGQAAHLAGRYGSSKVILHGGYNSGLYFPQWYVEQSAVFWKEFLIKQDPDVEIVLENVLETDPKWLLDIVRRVDDRRLRLCLDVGHVNAYSDIPVMEWLEICAPYISHFHIHNNDGAWDQHNALMEGSVPMREFLLRAETLCPEATFTLELMQDEASMIWLNENGLI